MPVEQRIRLCIMIEKMDRQKDYCKKIGLEDKSIFRGKRISKEEKIC